MNIFVSFLHDLHLYLSMLNIHLKNNGELLKNTSRIKLIFLYIILYFYFPSIYHDQRVSEGI